jgi:hypothetical protein
MSVIPSTTRPQASSTSPIEQEAARANLLPEIEIDQILYCSLARQPMSGYDLKALSESVMPINRMDHITGLLMYSDGVFVQLIEGSPQAVHHLWSRLLRDPRHFGVVQLYHYRELEQRTCQDWDMKLVSFETLRGIIHEAKEELRSGKHSVWAPAIERMDFLLTSSQWARFVSDMKDHAPQ